MTRFRALSFAALAMLALPLVAGCAVFREDHGMTQIGSGPYIQGSGDVASVERDVPAFTSVQASPGLSVVVSRGDANTVKVTTDDNLLAMVTSNVSGGKLVITVEGSLRTSEGLEVEVTAAQPVTSASVDSGSTLRLEDLDGGSLVASVSGGSTLKAHGHVAELTLSVAAGSTGDMSGLSSERAHVTVSAGSTARVRASQTVDGSCLAGSTLVVSGGADTSGVQKDVASTVTLD